MSSFSSLRRSFTTIVLCGVAFFVLLVGLPSRASAAGKVNYTWAEQFGTPLSDYSQALDADGNIYAVGATAGALPGEISAGKFDVFIRKYDSSGNLVWTDQFGSAEQDEGFGVMVSGTAVYVTGAVGPGGVLPGETSFGSHDGFIRRYDTDGNHIWTDQFGTSEYDDAVAVVTDGLLLYVVGQTEGAFPGQINFGRRDGYLRIYTIDGAHVLTVQIGTTAFDEVHDVFLNSTAAYVAGVTEGTLPGEVNQGFRDAFVMGFDALGLQVFSVQFGTSQEDEPFGVSADSSSVYVGGYTTGVFPGETRSGVLDSFVRKYRLSDEAVLWTDQFGDGFQTTTIELELNNAGVYLAGFTGGGALPGQTPVGGPDGFVRKYNTSGVELWTTQFGTAEYDDVLDMAAFGGALYVAGETVGVLPGETGSGGTDAYIARFDEDTDSDGLFDNVDTSDNLFSDAFSDGTTSGTVTTRGGQILHVIDEANSALGVYAAALPAGVGAKARVSACGGAVDVQLGAGQSSIITCGSALVKAVAGIIDALFFGSGGVTATSSIGEGNVLGFEPASNAFAVPQTNPSEVVVIVDGAPISLVPGERFRLVDIDIKPEDLQNCINPDAEGVIPVAVLTTPTFDALTVDPTTITLEDAPIARDPETGELSAQDDVDGDGDIDLLVHVENAMTLDPGQTTAELRGALFNGKAVRGVDAICIAGDNN